MITSKQNSVIELNEEELIAIDGGIKIPGPWGWLVSGAIYVADNWDDISKGFSAGYKEGSK